MLKRILCGLLVAFPAVAVELETTAKQAILVDMSTGTVLFEKNADERMPTSSMSKVLTMHVVFDKLKKGELSMEDTFPVSEKAWRQQGSKMFVELGNNIKVEDLVKGVVIQSGNDAAIVLAEGISGGEVFFAEEMNKKAKELGMTNSNFVNSTGWPDPDHYSTARDLAVLGEHAIKDFPEYYPIYSEIDYTYHGIKQGNRNPLLYANLSADGIKTGHTDDGGYGLIGSAERNGRRLIMVINGTSSMKDRAQESQKILEWGFREFQNHSVAKAGETLQEIPVQVGVAKKVAIAANEDVLVTLKRTEKDKVAVKMNVPEALEAPIQKGQKVGTMEVTLPDQRQLSVALIATQDVAKLGFWGRLKAKFTS